jgi:hypothetical protein
MRRYHGDIERNVYAAEILCGGTGDRCNFKTKNCMFASYGRCGKIKGNRPFCTLWLLREIVGDMVEQHHADGDGK